MAKKYASLIYNKRYLIPLMTGIIVGFAFSLLCSPFFDCYYDEADSDESSNRVNTMLFRFRRRFHARSRQEQEQFDLLEQQHQKQIDEFEPRINLQGKPKKPDKPVQKLIRPRYAKVELNIREKLFIGVVSTSRVLSDLASFQNQSITKHADKLTFFVNNANMNEKLLLETTPQGVNLVNFNDDRDNLLPFHSLKYAIDNYIDDYDWFFFVTDDTFVRAQKVLDLVNHISISQDLYMGHPHSDPHSAFCSLSSGILFSNTLLKKLLANMDWCTKNSYSENPSDNIGRCVLHSTNMACTQNANGQRAIFHIDSNFNFDNEIDNLMDSQSFNKSLTVHPVYDLETMKKLELYFDQVELDEIDKQIEKIEKNILETVCHQPEGCNSLTWPLGVPPAYKATSRHEIIRYDYFNGSHVFLNGDFDVYSEMSESYLQDINEVIEFSLSNLQKNHNDLDLRYQYRKLLNGYKRFDPTRGADYTLDLLLLDKHLGIEVHKRVNVMRPLGLIEIIPMPYVTENAKINLLVAFTNNNDLKEIENFFLSYEQHVCSYKEISEKVNLFVLYVVSSSDANASKKFQYQYKYLNDTIRDLSKRYSSLVKTNSRIVQHQLTISNETVFNSESLKQLAVAEHMSSRLDADALVLMIKPCTEMQSEFLNRVRLNTIKGSQVFFPIPFSEYAPNVIYPSRPFPLDVEIHKNVGFFNQDSFEFVSFYNIDFILTRDFHFKSASFSKNKNGKNSLGKHFTDLYDLFSSNSNINKLRATDQALKCRWTLINDCHKKTLNDVANNEKQRCLNQRDTNLGTKTQLAMHIMKNFDLLNNRR